MGGLEKPLLPVFHYWDEILGGISVFLECRRMALTRSLPWAKCCSKYPLWPASVPSRGSWPSSLPTNRKQGGRGHFYCIPIRELLLLRRACEHIEVQEVWLLHGKMPVWIRTLTKQLGRFRMFSPKIQAFGHKAKLFWKALGHLRDIQSFPSSWKQLN